MLAEGWFFFWKTRYVCKRNCYFAHKIAMFARNSVPKTSSDRHYSRKQIVPSSQSILRIKDVCKRNCYFAHKIAMFARNSVSKTSSDRHYSRKQIVPSSQSILRIKEKRFFINLASSTAVAEKTRQKKEIFSISCLSRVLAHRPCPKVEMFCPSVLQLFYGCSKVLMTNHGMTFLFLFFLFFKPA